MIVIFALAIVEVSVAYYSIMMSKTNQSTYMSVANSVSATTAEVVDVEDVKYLKDQISPIVKNSPIRPVVTEEYDEAQMEQYLLQFEYLQKDATLIKMLQEVYELMKECLAEEDNRNNLDEPYHIKTTKLNQNTMID